MRRAEEVGGVRPNVRVPDLLGLLAGTCHAAAQPEAESGWLAQILCVGLRPVAAHKTG